MILRRHRGRAVVLLLLCLFIFLWQKEALAGVGAEMPEIHDGEAQAWLVTFGPGQIYWERFGHNAIWLREPAAGIDYTFNFGFFDFDQKDFSLRFLQGRMLYFSVAQPAGQEFTFYQQENRSIRAQKLNLSRAQYLHLRNYLVTEIKPENRNYRYDYYLNNCSTRVRDALDIALNGALSRRAKAQPASLDFRQQTRRLTQMQFWYYLGLEIALGYPVDRPISRWEEMFIPMVVADEIATLTIGSGGQARALVSQDMMLYQSSLPAVPMAPGKLWPRYLLLGFLILSVAWVSGRFMPKVWCDSLTGAWLLISATNGLILAALWLLTDHLVAAMNANLLLFNPLLFLALVPAMRRLGGLTLAAGVMLSLLLLLLPAHQYNLDVIALVAPLHLGAAAYLLRRSVSAH